MVRDSGFESQEDSARTECLAANLDHAAVGLVGYAVADELEVVRVGDELIAGQGVLVCC